MYMCSCNHICAAIILLLLTHVLFSFNIIVYLLIATLIGTIGRVLSDSMITFSALLDIHIFVDFVNATFLPVLILAIGCLILVHIYYDKLV